MITTIRRIVATAAAIAAVAVAGAGQALAADATGRDYADHVRACRDSMGFSGTHNPGVMHQGYSGWDPSHTC